MFNLYWYIHALRFFFYFQMYFQHQIPYTIKSYGFSSSRVRISVGPERRLSVKELILLNSGAGEDSWESHGQQDQTSQS